MEIQSFCHSADDLKGIMRCLVESLMVETALLAHKSLLLLLLQFHNSKKEKGDKIINFSSKRIIGASFLLKQINFDEQIGSLPDDHDIFQNSVKTYQRWERHFGVRLHFRFPMSELNKVKEPHAENNDAGETEDDDDDDDDDEDSDDDDEDDGDDSEEESDDDEEDSDDEVEVEANGDGESDDDDDDDDDDDETMTMMRMMMKRMMMMRIITSYRRQERS
ncbi:Protein of unknown function D, partial [Prunus dulcis]